MTSADNRFWATIAAQTAGVLLLFFIGIIFDIWNEPCQISMEAGIHHIFIIAFLVFIGLLIGCIQVFVPTQRCALDHIHVDKTLKTFLWVDIPLLTLLVCLEGGLTQSVFSPLFFLIFIAYNAVEQENKLRRKISVLLTLGLSMFITSIISFLVYKDLLKRLFGISFLSITDFSSLDPTRYIINFFLVALISLLIYIVQLNIIRIPRGNHQKVVASTDDETKVDDVLDKPEYKQKESRKQRLTATPKRRYILALLFASIFIASSMTLLIICKSFTPEDVNRVSLSSDIAIWVAVFTAVVSAIGTISTIILAWRNDRRDEREKELEIAQLERELEASKEKPPPKPERLEENRK